MALTDNEKPSVFKPGPPTPPEPRRPDLEPRTVQQSQKVLESALAQLAAAKGHSNLKHFLLGLEHLGQEIGRTMDLIKVKLPLKENINIDNVWLSSLRMTYTKLMDDFHREVTK